MTVVVPCHKGDQHQAERLLKWIAELGKVDATCVLFCAKDCNHPYLLSLAQCAFITAVWEEDRENIKCPWSQKIPGQLDASGPNSLFRQLSMFFYLPKPKGPWLFLEPDAVPCRPDWYRLLKAEYAQAVQRGKPIMGFRVNSQTHPGSAPIPEHSSGVAIYPTNLPELCPSVWTCRQMAFDIAAAKEMCQHAHWTTQILDHYCAPAFASMHEADVRCPPSVCIYHADKKGSLLPFLRQRLGMASAEPEKAQVAVVAKPVPAPSVPAKQWTGGTCDIFIKTHAKDYDWLEWCLKSIHKFATGFRNVVVQSSDIFPANCDAGTGVDWIQEPDDSPGYLHQQSVKLGADEKTDADFILYMDSDCVFTSPVTPESFMQGGKPFWLKTPFGDARSDQQVWKPIMEKFVGRPPQHEFMRRHPFMVPRGALGKMREFCRYKHGVELRDYIMAQHVPGAMLTFSEWNCLGFFLHEFHHDMLTWLDTTVDEIPPAVVWQGFTHDGEGRKQQDIAKFKEILGGNELVCDRPEFFTVTAPSREPTVAEAIQVLVNEAHRDGFAKGRVLKQLKAAGLAKGGKLAPSATPSPAPEPVKQHGGVLLAIQSYPGANEAVKRHWKFYEKSGATRIVGVGTTDRKCEWPEGCETINIGKNSYINGPHLPKRLADILEWCLTQPEDWFIVSEYDCCFFNPIKPWTGFCAHLTGGQLPEAKATRFFHPPYLVDREMATVLMHELRAVIQEGHCTAMWPEASPDVALGLVADRLKITPNHNHFTLFSRNSLNAHGDLERAIQAARDNVDAIHGIKSEQELLSITSVLTNGRR